MTIYSLHKYAIIDFYAEKMSYENTQLYSLSYEMKTNKAET